MKKKILNLLFFVFVISLITFSIFEIILILFFDRLPLRLSAHFSGPTRVLTQYTKENYFPKNYFCLIGDSYAHGYGPWLYENVSSWRQPDYASQHIVNKRLGKDIITLGYPGFGNLGTSVSATAELKVLEDSNIYNLEFPEHIVYFFYEGNDLVNNIHELEKRGTPVYDENSSVSSNDIEQILLEEFNRKSKAFNLINYSLTLNLLFGVFGDFLERIDSKGIEVKNTASYSRNLQSTKEEILGDILIPEPPKNIIRVSDTNHVFNISDGPGLLLTDHERQLAFLSLEESLKFLKNQFQQSEISVVFIPSSLSIYQFSSERIKAAHWVLSGKTYGPRTEFSPSDAWNLCDYNRKTVREITKRNKVNLIDTVDKFRAKAKFQLLHDEVDRLHFNEKGYTILGNAIAQAMEKM